MAQFTVTFLPEGLSVSVPEGTRLIQAFYQAGLRAEAPCGGAGTCGKCLVRVLAPEEAVVLSCQTLVEEDMTVASGA